MAFKQLRLDVEAGLARLTFTDAARGNPIDDGLCAEVCEAAIQLSEDPRVRCVLLSAEGKAFSYGGDIAALVDDLTRCRATSNAGPWASTAASLGCGE